MDLFIEVFNSVAIAFLAATILLMIVVTYSLYSTIRRAERFETKLPIYVLIAGLNVVTITALEGIVALWT